jgi:hypothetical protein
MSIRSALLAGAAALAIGAAGCGSNSSNSSSQAPSPNAPEVSPAGDIPDNQAFVAFTPSNGGFSVKVPEGWSRTTRAGATTFTDKLNAVRVEAMPAGAPPTVRDARQTEVRKLASSVNGFQAGTVDAVTRRGGKAVRITYLASAKPNAVTGKAGTDAVERYVFFHNGRDLVLTLSGPKGADNVDPWRIVTDSVRWTP